MLGNALLNLETVLDAALYSLVLESIICNSYGLIVAALKRQVSAETSKLVVLSCAACGWLNAQTCVPCASEALPFSRTTHRHTHTPLRGLLHLRRQQLACSVTDLHSENPIMYNGGSRIFVRGCGPIPSPFPLFPLFAPLPPLLSLFLSAPLPSISLLFSNLKLTFFVTLCIISIFPTVHGE